jgi:hypothetical protein
VATPADTTPVAAPWQSITDYPVPVMDNVAAVLGGKLYSGLGLTDIFKQPAIVLAVRLRPEDRGVEPAR